MKIAITGGKGGTGKSTVATSLSHELSKTNNVLLVDADVDCPNDHLLFGINRKEVRDVVNMVPKIDEEKCIKCGRCAEVCKENAIVQVKGNYPIVVEDQCTGCKACEVVCPVGVISESEQVIGKILEGFNGNLDLISGELKPGVLESSLVVNSLKRYVETIEDRYDYIVIDTAAGTHCPVIAALLGVDIAFSVTEPTPLGEHDLKLILELLGKLDIESKVILNRSNISEKNNVSDIAEGFGSEIISQIPYSKDIEKSYSQGKPIVHESIEKIAGELR
ncbi:MAG: P-loop NTPase [Candidatus Aenigmatarchaeota archaeon]